MLTRSVNIRNDDCSLLNEQIVNNFDVDRYVQQIELPLTGVIGRELSSMSGLELRLTANSSTLGELIFEMVRKSRRSRIPNVDINNLYNELSNDEYEFTVYLSSSKKDPISYVIIFFLESKIRPNEGVLLGCNIGPSIFSLDREELFKVDEVMNSGLGITPYLNSKNLHLSKSYLCEEALTINDVVIASASKVNRDVLSSYHSFKFGEQTSDAFKGYFEISFVLLNVTRLRRRHD